MSRKFSRSRAPKLGAQGAGARRVAVVVPPALAGQRLDKALAALVDDVSRGKARKLIGAGAVYLGEQRCRVASRAVEAGDHLLATWHHAVEARSAAPLRVLYEDDDIVVVSKPAGQHVQGTELGDAGTLTRALQKRYGDDVRLMHRIDAGASGVLVAARHKKASGALTPQFREHTIGRRYLAITDSRPPDGPCERPLVKDGRTMRVARDSEDGLAARTEVLVLRSQTDQPTGPVLVEARLFTGRTHQIRVHLTSLGAPIVGDRRYGGRAAVRMCLHAVELDLQHPADGRGMHFEDAPGPDFWAAGGLEAGEET